MQRILTILSFVVLFGVGVYAIAGGFRGSSAIYEVPANPVLAAVLVGAIVVIVLLTIVTGGGLAFAFNWLSTQLAKDKPGASSEAKAGASQVAPYTPAYSYQAIPENVETRQWIVGSVIGLALLGLFALNDYERLSETAATFAQGGLLIYPAAAPTATATPVIAGPPELQQAFVALPAGDGAAGQQVFNTQPCKTCHVDQPLGPAIAGIGTWAATRREGYSAEIYIYESITQPNAYIVEGFADGLMPPNFKDVLTPQQISDLVAYLASLK